MIKISLDETLSKGLLDLLAHHEDRFNNAIRTAIMDTATRLRGEAGRNAPYRTGNLRRSITIQSGNSFHSAVVGTNLIYAPIQEYGGTIQPRSAKFLTFKIGGKFVRVKKVTIPPYRGRGFFRPALDTIARQAESIFQKHLERAITQK